MRKFTAVAALALLAATVLPSCKKDYKCECTSSMNGQTVGTSTYDLGKQTKKDAKDACNQKATSASTGGVQVSVECQLQ
ncbi:MAG TPA: hypothetical protein VFL76_08355 [Edaphocola sp.]|nr:hypothetical protein [Edaphocola sp.]